MRIFLIMFLITFFAGCSGQTLKKYKNEKPTLNLRSFFNGNVKALGIVQNRSGEVISRFKADIKASWVGNVATLDEDFVYADDSTSKRIWKLTENSDGTYTGTAGDVIGKANGEVAGNTFLYSYTLSVPVNGTNYDIAIEDWMYLLDNKTLLGRSYMTKFGFDVGEVTLVMINEGI